MALKKTGAKPDHDARSYSLTYSLLTSRSDPQRLIGAMNRETHGLTFEGHCEVLSRVIGNQLVLVDALLEAPGAKEIMEGFIASLGDATVTTAMAEVGND